VKKNLFNIHLNNSSSVVDQSNGSYASQETCEPCSLECEKMNVKINGRKLSDISEEEITKALSPFKY
jgi:excinuclease UvrABC ATPase subunit